MSVRSLARDSWPTRALPSSNIMVTPLVWASICSICTLYTSEEEGRWNRI